MKVLFRKQWSNKNLSSLKRSDWFVLTILSIFSGAIAPLLMFFSIKETLVSNIVLLSRLEPIFLLLITSILLKKHLNLKTVLGLSLSLFGLILAFLLYNLQQMSISFGRGEIFIIFHSLILACSTFLSSTFLSRIHVGIFTVFRTFVGAIIYFFTTIILFGASHFMDIFSPYLYKWTIIYALLIIVVGQLLWYTGLKHLSPQTISLTTSFSPIFGLFFAFFFWAKRRKPI